MHFTNLKPRIIMHRGYKSDDNDNFKSGILRELSLGNFEPDFLNKLKFLVFNLANFHDLLEKIFFT